MKPHRLLYSIIALTLVGQINACVDPALTDDSQTASSVVQPYNYTYTVTLDSYQYDCDDGYNFDACEMYMKTLFGTAKQRFDVGSRLGTKSVTLNRTIAEDISYDELVSTSLKIDVIEKDSHEALKGGDDIIFSDYISLASYLTSDVQHATVTKPTISSSKPITFHFTITPKNQAYSPNEIADLTQHYDVHVISCDNYHGAGALLFRTLPPNSETGRLITISEFPSDTGAIDYHVAKKPSATALVGKARFDFSFWDKDSPDQRQVFASTDPQDITNDALSSGRDIPLTLYETDKTGTQLGPEAGSITVRFTPVP